MDICRNSYLHSYYTYKKLYFIVKYFIYILPVLQSKKYYYIQLHLKSLNRSHLTINDYISASKKFLSFLDSEKIKMESMNIMSVEKYISMKNKKNIKNSSIIKIIHCIRSFLKFIHSRGYIDKDLASLVKTPRKEEIIKEFLSDIDIKKIENYLENREEKYRFENIRDKIIFYLGINCGLRRNEFIKLNWENIDFNECLIKIIRSKGGKSRLVCFSNKMKDLFLLYRKSCGNYNSALIRGSHGKRITTCSLQNIVRRIYKESGVYRENLTIHSLRHTFADRLRRKGIDIATISKLMGHSNIETTAVYLHSNNEDFKKAVL